MIATAALEIQTAQKPQPIRIQSLTVITGTEVRNHATVIAEIDGKVRTFESTGKRNGPVDAICHAFEPLVGEFAVKSWSGKGESEGSDAIGCIQVLLAQDEKTFHGVGHDTNTLVATAKAIADAFDKHRFHQWKQGKQ